MKFLLVAATLVSAFISTSHAKEFIVCESRINENLLIALMADTTDFSNDEPFNGILAYDDVNSCDKEFRMCTKAIPPQAYVKIATKRRTRMTEFQSEDKISDLISAAGKKFIQRAKLKYNPSTQQLHIRAGFKHYVLSCNLHTT